MLIVGPEGGISDEEIAALTEAGAVAVRLGPTVLRTSTAAAASRWARWASSPRDGTTRRRSGIGADGDRR